MAQTGVSGLARDEQQRSSATVGEKVARTVEHACSHRRHERRERRDQPAFAIARNNNLI